MRRRPYRAVGVKRLNVAGLSEKVEGRRTVVGVDVGREQMFAGVTDEEGDVKATVSFKSPSEVGEMVSLLSELPASKVEVVLEPSGTYGDALRYRCLNAGMAVYRVSAKRSHDAAEVYDGVASWHDRKSAALIAKLHLQGLSEPWPIRSEKERTLAAAISVMDLYDGQYHRDANGLEGMLARHWPEVTRYLELGSPTLLALLSTVGGAGAVSAEPERAAKLMRRVGGPFLKEAKVRSVIESARCSVGLPLIEEERRALKALAGDAQRAYRASQQAKQRVEELTAGEPAARRMAAVVGKATAAVRWNGTGV